MAVKSQAGILALGRCRNSQARTPALHQSRAISPPLQRPLVRIRMPCLEQPMPLHSLGLVQSRLFEHGDPFFYGDMFFYGIQFG